MEVFDELGDFLSDKPEMVHMKSVDGNVCLCYRADNSEKLNTLNKQHIYLALFH